MKYAKKHHIPIVLSFHTKYRDEFERVLKFKWMQHFVFNYMMKVIDGMSYVYVPIASVNEILKAYGYTKQTLGVIPNGTGMLPVADKTKACQEINASYQLDPYTFVMLFVGRMVSVKNLDLIIDALSIVVKENKNFKMLFVGEGAHKNTMQKNINHLGLAQHCLFLGQINDVKTLAMIYARANLFVFPSIFDTVPMVLFESASQATPLIGIKEAYLASSIQDKVNGYLSENNPQAFAEKIL
jgi:glycosyltransferase involved in cell wall biosynthesis